MPIDHKMHAQHHRYTVWGKSNNAARLGYHGQAVNLLKLTVKNELLCMHVVLFLFVMVIMIEMID